MLRYKQWPVQLLTVSVVTYAVCKLGRVRQWYYYIKDADNSGIFMWTFVQFTWSANNRWSCYNFAGVYIQWRVHSLPNSLAAISRVFDCVHQEIDAIDVVEGEGEDGDSEDINGTPMPPTPPLVTGNEGSGNESADEKEDEDDLKEPEGKWLVNGLVLYTVNQLNIFVHHSLLHFLDMVSHSHSCTKLSAF